MNLLLEMNSPDIHPLALEDILHKSNHSRSKADYYTQHLFISILCHYLVCRDTSAVPTADSAIFDELPYMPPGEKLDGDVQNVGPSNNLRYRNSSLLPTHSLEVRTDTWQSDGLNSLSRLLMKEKAVNNTSLFFPPTRNCFTSWVAGSAKTRKLQKERNLVASCEEGMQLLHFFLPFLQN
jgi:hypothetical protein